MKIIYLKNPTPKGLHSPVLTEWQTYTCAPSTGCSLTNRTPHLPWKRSSASPFQDTAWQWASLPDALASAGPCLPLVPRTVWHSISPRALELDADMANPVPQITSCVTEHKLLNVFSPSFPHFHSNSKTCSCPVRLLGGVG
jgi:hypothetical protein